VLHKAQLSEAIIIIIIIIAIKLSLGGSSPYTSADSCYSVQQSLHQCRQLSLSTAVLTPVQIKQIRINIHKRNNTKNTAQTIKTTANESTHIDKTPTHYNYVLLLSHELFMRLASAAQQTAGANLCRRVK
jgi:hypothetical protein